MEIRSVTIYGFGKWIDYTVDFGESAFVCIYGENESGKSTLYQFILFVLFGLPPKWRKFYRPKTSSQMGGSLTVFDPDIGEVTIERLDHVENGAARCYTPMDNNLTNVGCIRNSGVYNVKPTKLFFHFLRAISYTLLV